MSKKIAVGMLAACALAGIGARGEELNVAEDATVTLSESMSVDGGTVAGTLILSDGMTLTLTRNIFAASATLVLSNATVSGFAGAHDVSLPCRLVVAAETANAILNIHDAPDDWNANGCNVAFSGVVVGGGELTLRSTGRGFIVGDSWSGFEGTLNLDMSGNYFNGRINTGNLRNATVNVTRGQVNYSFWGGTSFGHLNVSDGAVFNVDRDADTENVLNIYGDSVLGGTFTGHQLDVNVYAGANVTVGSTIARVNIDAGAPTLAGGGTIGQLRTWGNPLKVANAPGETLTIESRAEGDEARCELTVTGVAVRPSGQDVLSVDPSRFAVMLAPELAASGWRLRMRTSGVYNLYRPGLCLVVR